MNSSHNISSAAVLNSEKSVSVNSLVIEEPIKFIDETVDEMYDRSHMNSEWKNEIIEELIGSLKKSCFTSNAGKDNNIR